MCIIGEVEDSAAASTGATDATVMRMSQRARDGIGSQSSDAVRVQRHMRKLSKSLGMRRQQLVRNKHGQLVLERGSRAIHRVKYEAPDAETGEVKTHRRYRIGYYRGGSGFVLVNDGRRAAGDVLRLLSDRHDWDLAS